MTKYAIIKTEKLFDSEPEKTIKDLYSDNCINEIKYYFKLNPSKVPYLKIDEKFYVIENVLYFKILKNKKSEFLVLLPNTIELEKIEDKIEKILSFEDLNKLYLKSAPSINIISFQETLTEKIVKNLIEDVKDYLDSMKIPSSSVFFNNDLNSVCYESDIVGGEFFQFKDFLKSLVKEYGKILCVNGEKKIRGISIESDL
ncbi:hypothetical protein D1818_13085 [Aquimarina sp. BL5]|uniref:hypothetical protein n=1 Tax=Aquimarina sp. BL5 TaxID=1714860 RepID=UPI000E49E0D0|nr:hypothetical protein [Aquimarina sp. BL5]AXT51730.1 hypothetical protein D1818_13085 [Aquimarina sp. BL5]